MFNLSVIIPAENPRSSSSAD